MERKVCPQCGQDFTPLSVNQIFCSAKCRNRYNHLYGGYADYSPKVFICAHCGKEVRTEQGDKRTRFCSSECERKFWRHPESRKHREIAELIKEKEAEKSGARIHSSENPGIQKSEK